MANSKRIHSVTVNNAHATAEYKLPYMTEGRGGRTYFMTQKVEASGLDELRAQLHAVGFSQRAITAVFRNVERREA